MGQVHEKIPIQKGKNRQVENMNPKQEWNPTESIHCNALSSCTYCDKGGSLRSRESRPSGWSPGFYIGVCDFPRLAQYTFHSSPLWAMHIACCSACLGTPVQFYSHSSTLGSILLVTPHWAFHPAVNFDVDFQVFLWNFNKSCYDLITCIMCTCKPESCGCCCQGQHQRRLQLSLSEPWLQPQNDLQGECTWSCTSLWKAPWWPKNIPSLLSASIIHGRAGLKDFWNVLKAFFPGRKLSIFHSASLLMIPSSFR